MSGDELRAARDEARRLQRRVNQKKSRLTKQKGVDFSRSDNRQYDPSVSTERINRYTLKQVQAANERMRTFLSRQTQYYGDSRGRVLPPDMVRQFKKEERGYLARQGREFMKIADVLAYKGDPNQTVYDVWKQRTPSVGLSHAANTNPLTLTPKRMQSITNAKSLETLLADITKRNTPEWFAEQREKHREQADIMLRRAGHEFEADRVADLDDEHFDLLWGDHRFAEGASMAYQRAQKELQVNTPKEWYDQRIEDSISDIDEVITWAATARRPRKGRSKSRRK